MVPVPAVSLGGTSVGAQESAPVGPAASNSVTHGARAAGNQFEVLLGQLPENPRNVAVQRDDDGSGGLKAVRSDGNPVAAPADPNAPPILMMATDVSADPGAGSGNKSKGSTSEAGMPRTNPRASVPASQAEQFTIPGVKRPVQVNADRKTTPPRAGNAAVSGAQMKSHENTQAGATVPSKPTRRASGPDTVPVPVPPVTTAPDIVTSVSAVVAATGLVTAKAGVALPSLVSSGGGEAQQTAIAQFDGGTLETAAARETTSKPGQDSANPGANGAAAPFVDAVPMAIAATDAEVSGHASLAVPVHSADVHGQDGLPAAPGSEAVVANATPSSSLMQQIVASATNLTTISAPEMNSLPDKAKSDDTTAPPAAAVGTVASASSSGLVTRPPEGAASPMASSAGSQIAVHVAQAMSEGGKTVTVELHPAELGRVEIHFSFHQDGMTVRMTFDRQETFDAFSHDRGGLEQQLAQAGVDLGSGGLDLTLGQQRDGRDVGARNSRLSSAPPVAVPAAGTGWVSNALLDIIA